MESISFKGKFISSIYINKFRSFEPPVKVSAVEINPLNSRDIKALKDIHSSWGSHITEKIYKEAEQINQALMPSKDEKFFVLTKQKENFANLNSRDILAEAKIIRDLPDNNSIYLDYLQVQPSNMFDSTIKEFEGIGSKMLDFLKSRYKKKEIHLYSLGSSIDFYLKNGFIPESKKTNRLFYKA